MTKENLEINLNELAMTKTLFVITDEQVREVIDIALDLKTRDGAPILAVLNNLLKINPKIIESAEAESDKKQKITK